MHVPNPNEPVEAEALGPPRSGEQPPTVKVIIGDEARNALKSPKLCPFCVRDTTRRGIGRRGLPRMTMCEVRKHCTRDDCWIVSKKGVYDATSFIDIHPGGVRSILRRSGGCRDCADDFEFHSSEGQRLWEPLKVGWIVPCDPTAGGGDSCSVM